MFTTADEFLISSAARDWSISLLSVSIVKEAQRRENVDLSMIKIFSVGLPLDTDPCQRCGEKSSRVKHAFEYPAPSNRGLGIQAKKCLCEGVIVPTALYVAEAWGAWMAKMVLMAEVTSSTWRAGTRLTEVRLDGWCEGGFGQ